MILPAKRIAELVVANATDEQMQEAAGRALSASEQLAIRRAREIVKAKKGGDSAELRYYHRKQTRAREVGELQPIANPERRARLCNDLAGWLGAYMPRAFFRPFSDDQLEAIRRIQTALTQGGTAAISMPRGTGKTTILEGAVLWATLNGHKRYPVVVAADQAAAESIVRDIKTELESNELLSEDFPEVCQAVRHLEGAPQKAASQTWNGEQTRIAWKTSRVVFPHHYKSAVSGTCITAKGLTSGIRGLKHKTGSQDFRPDFVFLDDPQTRESAESMTQTSAREKIILGDCLGLAGHDREMSAVMACTIIAKGDLADRFLNNEKRPEWHGLKTKLVYSWGTNEKLWEQYATLWRDGQADNSGGSAALEFYSSNRPAMDEGWRVASPELYDHAREASAIQHAFNLLLQVGDRAFRSEYQNDPTEETATLYDIKPDMITSRTNELRQFQIPEDMPVLVGFADINNRALHWCVAAFKNGYTGHVVSYGRHPERGELVPANATTTERNRLIFGGLADLVRQLQAIPFMRGNASTMLDAFAIDAGSATDQVYDFCRSTRAHFRLYPSRGFSASRYAPIPSRTIGQTREGCHLHEGVASNFLAHNADYWREAAQRAFLAEPGAQGSLSLFGPKALAHREFAEHVCNERLIDKAVGERFTLYKWQNLPGRNDWLDALVGCFALAAFQGLSTASVSTTRHLRRRPQRVAEAVR